MSEWIDFCVFALQAVMLWVVLPRWGAPFARHMLEDRNRDWAAAHPAEVERLARGGRLLPLLYAWGVISIAVLLAYRLNLQPDFVSPQADRTPGWEALQNASNALIAVGLIMMCIGFAASLRWLKRNVPLTERRQASLAPRTAVQYAPRWALWLVCAVAVAHLLAWVLVGVLRLSQSQGYWLIAAGMLFMTLVLLATLRYGVGRRPNHYDRALGPAYRQTEVRLYLAMILLISVMGLIGLYREVTGFDTDRMASLVVALFIILCVASLARLPARSADGDGAAAPGILAGQ